MGRPRNRGQNHFIRSDFQSANAVPHVSQKYNQFSSRTQQHAMPTIIENPSIIRQPGRALPTMQRRHENEVGIARDRSRRTSFDSGNNERHAMTSMSSDDRNFINNTSGSRMSFR